MWEEAGLGNEIIEILQTLQTLQLNTRGPSLVTKCQINNLVGIYITNSRGETRCEDYRTENGGKELNKLGDESKEQEVLFYAQARELVVAICTENASWVDDWAPFYHRVAVYLMCGRNVTFQSSNVKVLFLCFFLANIGTYDNAFLTYVVTRYHKLPGRVSFSKRVEHKHGLLLVTDPRLDTKFYIEMMMPFICSCRNKKSL